MKSLKYKIIDKTMMKLKNIFGILAISAVSMMTVSCSDDIMDRINRDEAHPGGNAVTANIQLSDAIVASVFTTNCGNFAWYASIYTEQTFGTGNNQAKNAELRNVNEIAASSTFDNEWNGTYLNLNNIKQLIAKCDEGGVSVGQSDIQGMGQVLAAYNWSILTDLFGDIPCSKALTDGVSAPALDKQEDIYNHCFTLLDAAITNFDKAIAGKMKNAGAQDVLFANDNAKWRGLAHALKARLYLHELGRATDKNAQLTNVLTEANAAIADGFDGATLNVFDGNANVNSWSAYWNSRDYIASTTTVNDLLTARQDPREPIYHYDIYYNFYGPKNGFQPSTTICTPGNESQAMSQYYNAPEWLSYGCDGGAVGSHMFSKSELYFIIAEVKARLGQDAKADFETAVKASMEDYAASSGETISDDAVSVYLAGETATKFAANPLSEILVQKYIAQTRDEQLETYNDMRRCNYVDGSYPVAMTNPKNTQANANRWPLRLPYGSSDVLSNPNVKEAFGSGNDAGKYIFTENVWWAGGSR